HLRLRRLARVHGAGEGERVAPSACVQHPFVPAKAGTQPLALDSRFRGNERKRWSTRPHAEEPRLKRVTRLFPRALARRLEALGARGRRRLSCPLRVRERAQW